MTERSRRKKDPDSLQRQLEEWDPVQRIEAHETRTALSHVERALRAESSTTERRRTRTFQFAIVAASLFVIGTLVYFMRPVPDIRSATPTLTPHLPEQRLVLVASNGVRVYWAIRTTTDQRNELRSSR